MLFRHKIVKCIAWFIGVVGTIVILGWVFDTPVLKSILPQWASMKFSTATCFVSSGVMLFFMVKAKEGHFTLAQTFIAIATLIITMFMSSLLMFVILHVKTGIEDLFVKESALTAFTPMPGRPSIGTMVNFLFVSISGLVAMTSFRRVSSIMKALAFSISIIGSVAIIGYILNISAFYYVYKDVSGGMALHTAILFVLYSVGLYLLYIREDKNSRAVGES